jgi:hypothetical protein
MAPAGALTIAGAPITIEGVVTTTARAHPSRLSPAFSAAFSAAGYHSNYNPQHRLAMRTKKMTPQEIAVKADQLKNEANAVSIPLSTAGQLALFKQVKRIANDLCVLIRELAESK